MSKSTDMMEGASFLAENELETLANLFDESGDIQKNNMFAEMHGMTLSEYNSDDFIRVEFSKQDDMVAFTDAMKEKGVTDFATVSMNGNSHYLLEMSRETSYGSKTKDLIEEYERETGREVESVSNSSSGMNIAASTFESVIARDVLLKNLDGASEVLNPIIGVMQWSQQNAYQDENRGTDIFHRKPNEDGQIDMAAQVGRNSVKAVVLNHDTVVINGEVVTDSKIRETILKQHEQRMEYVNDDSHFGMFSELDTAVKNNIREQQALSMGASSLNETADTVGRLMAKEHNVGLSSYEQEVLESAKQKLDDYTNLFEKDYFDVNVYRTENGKYSYSTGNISVKEFGENNERLLKSIEDQGFEIRKYGKVFDADAYKKIGADALSGMGISGNMSAMLLDVNSNVRTLNAKQDLAEHIKENAYRQEYSYQAHTNDRTETIFCNWEYGSLGNIVDELNESNVALQILNTEKLGKVFSKDEIELMHRKLKEAGVSESILYTNSSFAANKLESAYVNELGSIEKRLKEIAHTKKMLEKAPMTGERVSQYAELSREERDLKNKKVEIARERTDVQRMIKNMDLDVGGKDALLVSQANRDILNDITNSDLFRELNIDTGKINMSELLKVNKQFIEKGTSLGYHFIKADGTFDIKLLKSMSAKELQDKFGITESTRDMLVRINEKGAWGKKGGSVAGTLGSTMMFFVNKGAGDDGTLQELSKAVNYSKEAIKIIRQFGTTDVEGLIRTYRNKAKTTEKNSALSVKFDKKKKPTTTNSKVNEKQVKRVQKYTQKQEKDLIKIGRKKKSLMAEWSKAYQRVQEAIAKSLFGKAYAAIVASIHAFLGVLAGGIVIVGSVMGALVLLICIVYFCIMSFLNANPQAFVSNLLAPETYEETVAWQLYLFLEEQEGDFVKSIDDTDTIFANRATYKYGPAYKSYNNYIASEPRIVESEGEMYINPFRNHGCANAYHNKSKMTKITEYDGTMRFDISTNMNTYMNIDGEHAIETGHTSNIKDILCMVDVMYQFSMDDNSDEGLNNVLGMAPAQLDWNNFCEKVKNFFKWIGNTISELLQPSEDPPYILVKTYNYKTIQNYAASLFQSSHQQLLTLKVEYYDRTRKMYVTDGRTVQDVTETNFAQEYGFCTNPVSNQFNIRYEQTQNKVCPYLTDYSGLAYNLDENHFDVKVDMGMLEEDDYNKPCVDVSWGDNEDTFDTILDICNGIIGNHCWYLDQNSVTVTEISGQCESSNPYYASQQAYHSALSHVSSNSYDLSDDKNRMYVDEYVYDMEETYTTRTIDVPVLDNQGNPVYDEEGNLETTPLTLYNYKYRWGYKNESTYRRSCRGHYFEYCGGHISCHSKGIVYSATNEQLALTSVFPQGTAPCVPSFYEDKDTMGYKEIEGKIIKSQINKSDVVSASGSGGCPTPLYSIQGSFAGSLGLNLWIENGDWKAGGGGIDNSRAVQEYTMDIFDVDMSLKKGADIFPLTCFTQYEGWTAENMELALCKMSMDWYEAYGFDIPWEITYERTSSALSTDDIDKIVNGLRASYGSRFTQTREEAVRFALAWVNRGHYAEGHSTHSFLADYCVGLHSVTVRHADGTQEDIRRKGNCTGGTDLDFANYMYRFFGKINFSRGSYVSLNNPVAANYSNVLPADVVSHQGIYNYTGQDIYIPMDASELERMGYTDAGDYIRSLSKQEASLASSRHAETQTTVFIGMLNENIELSTGQKLYAGIPILVDMQRTRTGGCITLHGKSSIGGGLGLFRDREFIVSGDDRVYYWADHPDGRVSYYSFE